VDRDAAGADALADIFDTHTAQLQGLDNSTTPAPTG